MEIVWILSAGAAALTALVLGMRLASLRRCLREITEQLDEKLRLDTNTPILASGGGRAARALASRLNAQLRALRQERLRLRSGDAGLKAAVTNLSHDLRTPLTAVCGYLDLLERQPHSDESRRYLAVIRERTGAMRALTEELLQYSVVRAASDEPAREPVCLNDALEESLAGFYGVLTARGIGPDVRLPAEKIVRRLDGAALRRVLDNILGNAARYSDGDLSVELTEEGEIRFSNAAEKLGRVRAERLFDRFFTVESASGSMGLGLSIARELTERMGGLIAAEYRDGRLCVRVRFPGGEAGAH